MVGIPARVSQAGEPDAEPNLIAAMKAPGVGHASAKRAHFLAELVKLIPKEIVHFGKRLDRATDLGDGGVEMHFTDGGVERADAVIGCDGIKSRFRKMVLGEDSPASWPSFTGKYAWRALLPMNVAREKMGDEYAMNAQMFLGKNAYAFILPLEKGNLLQMVATYSKPEWDREEWMVEADSDEMIGGLKGWVAPIGNILPFCYCHLPDFRADHGSLIETNRIWAMFDFLPASTYTNGSRICLLGDAAHASTPHQESGGGMAMEDAFILAKLLAKIQNASNIPKVLKVYDAVRRPRSQRLVATSREAGRLYDLELTEGDEQLREKLEFRYKWIWDADQKNELAQALEVLNASFMIDRVNGIEFHGDGELLGGQTVANGSPDNARAGQSQGQNTAGRAGTESSAKSVSMFQQLRSHLYSIWGRMLLQR